MSNIKTATEATQKPPPGDIPDFAREVDESGRVVFLTNFFTNFKGRKIRYLPPRCYKKSATVHRFYDVNTISQVGMTHMLSYMSVSEEDEQSWKLCMHSDAFGQMFDSSMCVVCETKLVEVANDARFTMTGGSKPKMIKEVVKWLRVHASF